MTARIGLFFAVAACAHGRLQAVPLLLAPDVLVDDPAQQPRAQILRQALVRALKAEDYCLDRAGDFEGMLDLRVDTAGGEVTAVLTLDTAAGTRVDEEERTVRGALPVEGDDADAIVRPLLHDLAASGETREFAGSVSATCGR